MQSKEKILTIAIFSSLFLSQKAKCDDEIFMVLELKNDAE